MSKKMLYKKFIIEEIDSIKGKCFEIYDPEDNYVNECDSVIGAKVIINGFINRKRTFKTKYFHDGIMKGSVGNLIKRFRDDMNNIYYYVKFENGEKAIIPNDILEEIHTK